MKQTKLETAKKLAEAHFKVDSDLKHVYLLEPLNETDEDDPIKLLEVVEGTIERGEPIAFAPDPGRGINYPIVIVEISPKEYRALSKKQIDFGNHVWQIGPELTQ